MALENITSKLDLLAEILGVTPRRIQQLVDEEVIPRPEKPGQYDIPACVQAYYYKEFCGDEDDELDGRHERARKAKVEAERPATRAEVAAILFKMMEQAKLNPNAKLAEAMRKKTGEGFVVESATVQGSIGTIPAGAVVPVELTEYISSQTSEAGDLYLGRAAQNYVTKDKFILVKEGATLKGQLVDVRPGKWFVRNGVLILDNALITTENDQTVKFSGVADVKKHRNWFMKFVRFCFKGEKLEVQAEGFVNLKLLKPVVVDLTNGWIIEE